MNEHIFDILGIGSREDSYTDLIAYAFKHSSDIFSNDYSNSEEASSSSQIR